MRVVVFFENSEAVRLICFEETLVLTLGRSKGAPLFGITLKVTSEAFGAPWPVLDSKTMLLSFRAHIYYLAKVDFALAAN